MSATSKYAETWELDTLLPHPESDEFTTLLAEHRQNLTQLAERSDDLPKISSEPETVSVWKTFLEEYATIESRAHDLNAFAGCYSAGDANNITFQQLEGQLAALDPLRERIATNIEFALQAATADEFAQFLAADPELTTLSFFLQQRQKNASHRLPKQQELLSADLAVDGIHAWGRLYDRISGALKITVMERGELVEKSVGQVQFDSPQRQVRENNFYAATKSWSSIGDTCADALNHISGTRLTKYRWLGLEDHLDAPLQYNRMTRETLTTLWNVVSERKPMLLKYLQKKADAFGLEKLTWYDVPAPYPTGATGTEQNISYDTACDLIVKTFSEFSPDFGKFAQMAIDDRWIEVENRSGKRQGGFCTGFPTAGQTRIFMTYTNSIDSMSTLAHELGHAYHSWVLRESPFFLQRYPMNLAETASTFAEAVLGQQQLNAAKTKSEELTLLDSMLGDSVSFLMNIHARFLFEDKFHSERQAGELTAKRFSELMQAAQQEAYCDGLDDAGWYPDFWISKLHFYISGYPFYNFPYTFGYLLSLGIYALSQEMGAEFPEQYRKFLIATGSMEAEAAVQSTFGYDLREPTFWNKSLDVVEQRVERFLTLATD